MNEFDTTTNTAADNNAGAAAGSATPGAGASLSALQSIVGEVLVQVAPDADPDTLDPAMNFRDQFEFDSVDFLNFVMTLGKRLGILIPEMDCPQLASMDGCLAYLSGKGLPAN